MVRKKLIANKPARTGRPPRPQRDMRFASECGLETHWGWNMFHRVHPIHGKQRLSSQPRRNASQLAGGNLCILHPRGNQREGVVVSGRTRLSKSSLRRYMVVVSVSRATSRLGVRYRILLSRPSNRRASTTKMPLMSCWASALRRYATSRTTSQRRS